MTLLVQLHRFIQKFEMGSRQCVAAGVDRGAVNFLCAHARRLISGVLTLEIYTCLRVAAVQWYSGVAGRNNALVAFYLSEAAAVRPDMQRRREHPTTPAGRGRRDRNRRIL